MKPLTMNNRLSLFVGLVLAMTLSACSTTKYISLRPELESTFQYLEYDEIVKMMSREPDEILTNEKGGKTLVYNAIADGAFFKDNYNKKQFRSPSKMFLRILLDKDDVCYTVQTNIQRKVVTYNRDQTEAAIGQTAGNILYMFVK